MIQLPIYLDNHATTRVDPRVMAAMLPYFSEVFGNAGSNTHVLGHAAKAAVDAARENIAAAIGARAREIVFTSGATESNNLAIRGVAEKLSPKGRHLVSVVTEHPAVLEPLERLRARGFQVTLLPVVQAPSQQAGLLVVDQLAEVLRDDTILVSVMLANNEIGVIQPLAEIGRLCRDRGVLLHSDATQAVGKIPVDVQRLPVDLMSFSAHKLYGPKGIGALYVRSRAPRVRLEPLLDGGGQEGGLRSGTLNVPGIVGLARALELSAADMAPEADRLRMLRDRLWQGLAAAGVSLNGPALAPPEWRLPGNLNVSFAGVDGEALLLEMKDVAASSGSACTSASPEPSHVLRSLGLSDETVRGSVRFGLGRFNTLEEVEWVIERAGRSVQRLRAMAG
ncbi:MAG: aminotransferase class V-fold PLP-dependent enzyme [Thermoguttaceae bacterium]